MRVTRPAQLDLFPPPRPAAVAARAPERRAEAFEFNPGPECEPDPDYVPPEWLKLPGVDD